MNSITPIAKTGNVLSTVIILRSNRDSKNGKKFLLKLGKKKEKHLKVI
jgi:hypothetical protein